MRGIKKPIKLWKCFYLKLINCFKEFSLVSGVKLKREKCVGWLFFKIDLCSTISFETSRRELSNDMAEHRSILKSKGEMRILVVFQDRPMFSHII